MKLRRLDVGKTYRVTESFADAVAVDYLVGKTIIHEGVVKNSYDNPREGQYEVEQHTFKVTDSEERIMCAKSTPIRMLARLLDP